MCRTLAFAVLAVALVVVIVVGWRGALHGLPESSRKARVQSTP